MIADTRVHASEFATGNTGTGATATAAVGKAAGTAATTSTTVIAVGVIAGAIITVTTVVTLAVVLTRSSDVSCATGITATACSASLEENLQDVATDCEHDLGVCSSDSCEGCDGKCCGAIFESQTVTCPEGEVTFSKVVNCSCVSCDSRQVSVSGRITGECTDDSTCDASIMVDGTEVARSNSAGYYTMVTTQPTSGTINMEIVADSSSYLRLPQQVQVSEDAQTYVDVKVPIMKRATVQVVDATSGADISVGLNNDVTVSIPPNSIFAADGTAFSGNADVSVNFVDTASAESTETMNVELSVVEDGETQLFYSLGMFVVSMTSQADSSQNLQGQGIQITVLQGNESAALVPFIWELQDDGTWKKIQEVSRQARLDESGRLGRSATGSIDVRSIPRIYNLDALLRRYCYMKVETVTDQVALKKVRGTSIKAVYKPTGRAWSRYMKRRTNRNGFSCLQIPCNRNSWPSERVHVEVPGFLPHGSTVDDSTMALMNFTAYGAAFDLTIPESGDIPTDSDKPFSTSWYGCYNAESSTTHFRFIKKLVDNPVTASPSRVLHCQNIELIGNEVLSYFDSGAALNISRYSLSTVGIYFDGKLITGADITPTALNDLNISVYYAPEQALHHMRIVNNQLTYSLTTDSSDPFNGTVTSVAALGGISVSISFRVSGNLALNGATYDTLVIDSKSPVSGSVSVPDFMMTTGVSASSCFASTASVTTTTTTATPATNNSSNVATPSAATPSNVTLSAVNLSTVTPSNVTLSAVTPPVAQNFLRCKSVVLGAEAMGYFDSTTSLNISRYSVTPNGIIYDGQLIPVSDPQINGLYNFSISVFSGGDEQVHYYMRLEGNQLLYSVNTATSDPFNGVETVIVALSRTVSIKLMIAGNIVLNEVTYDVFVLDNYGDAFPGSTTIDQFVLSPGITLSDCVAYNTNIATTVPSVTTAAEAAP